MKYLTHQKIEEEFFKARPWGTGASVFFFGTVRGSHQGKKVTHLTYEAYEVLAEAMIEDILKRASKNWRNIGVQILHRLGKVATGEIAVAIEVCSAHRDEAYQTSRFLIDEIKSRVPIWKKEYFEDGIYQWGICDHHGLGFSDVPRPPLFEINSDVDVRKDIRIVGSKYYQQMSREREYLNEVMV